MGGSALRGPCGFLGALTGIVLCGAMAVGEEATPDRGQLTLGAGYDFSRGDYGGRIESEIHYASLLLAYLSPEVSPVDSVDAWIGADLTLPYLWSEGPAAVQGRRARRDAREQGLGDLLLRLSYWIAPTRWRWAPTLEMSGQVKLPTASRSRGLGTGQTDYTVELGLSRRIGAGLLFASGARRFMGDPSGLRLRDRWLASAGASLDVGSGISIGLLYDYRQAALRGTRDAHELVPFSHWTLGERWRIGPYALIGLSRGSPDFALGLQLRVDLLD